MDTKQPEAMRVAAWLITAPQSTTLGDMLIAGRELRRLHAENEALRAGYDAARLEIASLHAQLEAVGAGGVSALMGVSQTQPVGAAPVAELVTTAHGFETTLSLLPGHFDLPYGTHLLYAAPQPGAQALDARDGIRWREMIQAGLDGDEALNTAMLAEAAMHPEPKTLDDVRAMVDRAIAAKQGASNG